MFKKKLLKLIRCNNPVIFGQIINKLTKKIKMLKKYGLAEDEAKRIEFS